MLPVENMENVEKEKNIRVSVGCSPVTITLCVFIYI